MLVSTFELLVKSQLPKNLVPPPPESFAKLSRTAIQGYFLTLANTTSSTVIVSLVFTSVTPFVDIEKTFVFLDVTGENIPGDLIPDIAGNKARFTVKLPANDTGLFILQPDILKTDQKAKLYWILRTLKFVVMWKSLCLRFPKLNLQGFC
jgi:hypothetical protein